MLARPRRSVLYMPGSNAKALAKASTLPADALILDSSRSPVAPDQKVAARGQVTEAARNGSWWPRGALLASTDHIRHGAEEDLAAASAAGPDAVLLPKVDGPAQSWPPRGGAAPSRRARENPDLADGHREMLNAVLNAGSIAAVAADLRLAPHGDGDGAQRSRQGSTCG